MSGNDDEPSEYDLVTSSRSEGEPSETHSGPAFGRVPPASDISPGWGIIEDGGGAPSILEVLEPEGSMRAMAPTLRFYDIDTFEHKIWQATLHPDRPITEGDTCCFPVCLVHAVERERDYLLDERIGLTAQVELLQRDLERSRAETAVARTEAETAMREIQGLRT